MSGRRIGDLVLFVSSTSEPCKYVLQRAQPLMQGGMVVIRLDTHEHRRQAMSGKKFVITSVPTLVVVYQDGGTQLYVGIDHILKVFDALTAPTPIQPPPSSGREIEGEPPLVHIAGGGDDEEDTPIVTEEPPKPKKKKKVVAPPPPPEEEEEGIDQIEIPVEPPSTTRPKKKKKKRSEISGGGILVDDYAGDSSFASTSGGGGGKSSKHSSSRMGDIFAAAKRMEEQRNQTLGRKEDE